MIQVKIKKDTQNWQKVRKNLTSIDGVKVRTGWWGKTHSTGVPIAQVAKWNEEGHFTGGGGYSPPRPFITVGWLGAMSLGLNSRLKSSLTKVVEGDSSAMSEAKSIGKYSKKVMQEQIRDWTTPPNRPLTISKKGFNNPLIDTGEMLHSVEVRVVKNE